MNTLKSFVFAVVVIVVMLVLTDMFFLNGMIKAVVAAVSAAI